MKLPAIALIFSIIGYFGGGYLKSQIASFGENEAAEVTEDPSSTTDSGQVTAEKTEVEDEGSGDPIRDYETATIQLFERAAPSVCYITTTVQRRDYWSRNTTEIPAGSGSGFIWDEDGHIVTNYHVIRDATSAMVTLSDQSTYSAKLVGIEPSKDLAVLKIDAPAKSLRPIKVGSSQKLKVGQFVMAIGNPFGLDQTLTTGVISALGREIQSLTGRPIRDVIQTDAAINPGNSGGPLLDRSGKLIGVNTQIYSPSGASAGIGFSIPVDEVKWVVPDLIKYGEVRRPVLGITALPAQYAQQMGIKNGIMIADLSPNGPAAKAGLKAIQRLEDGRIDVGDIITRINNVKVTDINDLILKLEKYSPGDIVEVRFTRDEKEKIVKVKLAASRSE